MKIYENGMSPNTETVKNDVANIGKSYHNLSRVHQCQGIIGAEMPIDVIKTIPDDSFKELKYLMQVTSRNPLTRELRNGVSVAVHAYWSPCSELWEGWNNYITKGRTGKVNLTVPKLLPSFKNSGDSNNIYTTMTPCSPADYMGVPIRQFDEAQLKNSNYNYVFQAEKLNNAKTVNKGYEYGQTGANVMGKWGINALPFVMYNKIHRDYYMNQNLMQSNKNWFPDNDKEFILPYNCTTTQDNTFGSNETHDYVNCIGKNAYIPTYNDTDKEYICDEETSNNKPFLNKLHFRQFRGDYFTSANPFADLLRGDAKEIDDAIGNIITSSTDNWNAVAQSELSNLGNITGYIGVNTDFKASYTTGKENNAKLFAEMVNKSLVANPGLLNNIRKAIVLEKFMQRNGATNGTYRELIGVQFGYKPNQFDGKPRYIGGGVFNIDFDSVTMQGADTNTQNTGDKVSTGIGTGVIDLGEYHCDDYGYIMVIATIIPDVYYNRQGLETMWTCTTQDKEYFPILNNLAPQPILNKELYLSTENDNEDVYGYTERFADLRSRQNIATGLNAVGSLSVYDSANLMHRNFNAVPKLNTANLTMYPNNIDLTPFYDAKEIPFDMLIGCKVEAMRKIPYSSKPADMGIKY